MTGNYPYNFLKNIPKDLLFFGLLGIGFLFRFIYFGAIPSGFQGDVASIGYEALSLLETGRDRWGFRMPPYFLSWGSGQNTLYAYLLIPIVWFLGTSIFSINLLSGILGALCIPLSYSIVNTTFKNKAMAQMAALICLFDPFLFMTSRWGIEMNIVPFFVLFMLAIHAKAFNAMEQKTGLSIWNKLMIIFTLPSAALLFYAYAASIFIVPIYLLILFIYYRYIIIKELKLFLVSAFCGLVIIFPFASFILKNNILKHTLFFEKWLPFDIPIMLSDREQIFQGITKNSQIIKDNMTFLFSGNIDWWIYNTTNFRTPNLLLFFVLPALIFFIFIFKNHGNSIKQIILFWFISCLPIFFLYIVNLNRTLHFQAILPIMAAIGIFFLYQKLLDGPIKKLFVASFTVFYILQLSAFLSDYFIKYPKYNTFPKNIEWAVNAAKHHKKPQEKVAFTSKIIFNYLYVALYMKVPPADFQNTVITDRTTGNVIVKSFGDYYMLGDIANYGHEQNLDVVEQLKKENSFLAMLHVSENPTYFEGYSGEDIQKDQMHDWKIMRFTKIN